MLQKISLFLAQKRKKSIFITMPMNTLARGQMSSYQLFNIICIYIQKHRPNEKNGTPLGLKMHPLGAYLLHGEISVKYPEVGDQI